MDNQQDARGMQGMANESLQQQVASVQNDPRLQAFLNVLAQAEGTTQYGDQNGYNVLFGGDTVDSLESHPNVYKSFKQTNGKSRRTSAAGRYQILKGTWDEVSNKLGLKDFSPASQDAAATALIIRRGALNDILDGNIDAAVQKLGKEWTSLPSSTAPQSKRSIATFNRYLAEQGLAPLTGSAAIPAIDATAEAEPMTLQGGMNLDEPFGYEQITTAAGPATVIPQTEREAQLLAESAQFTDDVRLALLRLNESIGRAKQQVQQDDLLFDATPSILDEELLDVIRDVRKSVR